MASSAEGLEGSEGTDSEGKDMERATLRLEVVRAEPGEGTPAPGAAAGGTGGGAAVGGGVVGGGAAGGAAAERTSVYEVPFDDRTSVLDALGWVKDNLDPTLTYRWSCRMAICGSCGVMVNGRPVLACETFVRGYRTTGLKVGPLAHFEVLRDLVVETDGFLGKLASVSPWLVPDDGAAEGSLPVAAEAGEPGGDPSLPGGPAASGMDMTMNVQSPVELRAFGDFAQCIDCMLCYAACPQLDQVPGFLGPAAVATARRWDADSRDHGELLRADAMDVEEGVWPCVQIGACTQVCPKGVDPAKALRDAQRVATETWETRQG